MSLPPKYLPNPYSGVGFIFRNLSPLSGPFQLPGMFSVCRLSWAHLTYPTQFFWRGLSIIHVGSKFVSGSKLPRFMHGSSWCRLCQPAQSYLLSFLPSFVTLILLSHHTELFVQNTPGSVMFSLLCMFHSLSLSNVFSHRYAQNTLINTFATVKSYLNNSEKIGASLIVGERFAYIFIKEISHCIIILGL